MKKNKFLSLLCLVFFLISSFIGKTYFVIKAHADEGNLVNSYLQLSPIELEALTNRTSVSNSEAQITVFTHS